MAISDIKLRALTNPPLTTKGSALTFSELDQNFIEVYAAVSALNTGGALPVFAMATTYTGLVYVKYNNQIWAHVSATPTVGVIPGTNAAKWQQSNIGAFAHLPGTDDRLGAGTANEVTAAQIKSSVNQFVTVTAVAFSTAITGATLIPGKIYEITNSIAWGSIFVTAIKPNAVSNTGMAYIKTPIPGSLTYGGVWQSGSSYSAGALVAWDGQVYKNNLGNNSSTLTPAVDGTNWTVQTGSNLFYNEAYQISIKHSGNGTLEILSYKSLYGNNQCSGTELVTSNANRLFLPTAAYQNNQADTLSDIAELSRSWGFVTNNIFFKSKFKTNIGGRFDISDNTLIRSEIEITGAGNGEISECYLKNTKLQWPNGMGTGSGVALNECTFDFQKETQIRMRSNAGSITGHRITENGSTVEDVITFQGITKLNRQANGYPHIYGTIKITSTNANETLEQIENDTYLMPLIIKPDPDANLQLTISLTDSNSVTTGAIVGSVSFGGSVLLRSDRHDYAILEPKKFDTIQAFQLTFVSLNQ